MTCPLVALRVTATSATGEAAGGRVGTVAWPDPRDGAPGACEEPAEEEPEGFEDRDEPDPVACPAPVDPVALSPPGVPLAGPCAWELAFALPFELGLELALALRFELAEPEPWAVWPCPGAEG